MKKLFGSQTEQAIRNFPISGSRMPVSFIKALALIKEHAAIVNGELGEIPKNMARAIATAAREIMKGQHMDQFPVDVFQTGSGTSTNMNMNEVIATLANQNIHPNDHVNRCQSSNDVIPTALQISCALAARDRLLPLLGLLAVACEERGAEFHEILKTGRTHLMDAVPIRLGDEFRSFSSLLLQVSESIGYAMGKLCVLPLGGTAVGTGINAHPKFAAKVIKRMGEETGLPLIEAEDHIAAQSCPLILKSFAAALGELAAALMKISNDIRLMSSGPAAGFGELIPPALQKGSSIMPGKVNPVLCESVEQVCLWIQGMEVTVSHAIASASRFQLHTAYPLMAHQLLTGIDLLANVMEVFAKKCVRGIKANTKKIAADLAKNAMLVTALGKEIGYEEAAKIAKEAMASGKTLLDVAVRRTTIPRTQLKKLLDPRRMV